MKKSIFLFFAAILCAMTANAWGYKTAAGSWNDCNGSESKFTNVTMNSGTTLDVVMLKDVGDGLNILQNQCGGQALYCKWTKASGDIFRGTARWNNGLYCDETVVIPEGKVYIKVGSGEQVQMTAGADYTYTADVTISTTGESYTISGETVNGATINNESDMPAGGKPSTLTMSNLYTSKNSGSVHIVFDLKTNKVTETAETPTEPEPDPTPEPVETETIYFVNAEDWTGTINVYAWTDSPKVENAVWPGAAATKETNQIAGHDVYSFTAEKGKFAKVIFNNNNGKQTGDLAWTAGQYICKNEWCADEAAVLAKLTGPVEYESVYFINVKNWTAVNIYTWSPEIGTWPGKAMTKEENQIAGYDVYSYTVEKGTTFGGMKFNEGNGKRETGNLIWATGKYYVVDLGWLTKEEAEAKLAAPLPEVWNIVGAAGLMGKDWDLNATENAMTKQEDGTYKLEKKDITLTAGTYEYKAAKDHGWDVSVPSGNTNQKLTISKSGIYDVTFVLDVTAKKLTATATLKKEAVVIPTVVIAGDMNSWNQTKDKFTMAADSLTATFKATLAAKSYGFKMIVGGAWLSDGKTITRANNSTVFTGANSNNNTKITADIAGEYTFTWTYETKTLTVSYPVLPIYTVTIAAENGTVEGLAADGKYEHGTKATLTATAAEGYEFVNWTVGGKEVSAKNPYTFTVTADVALVANFAKKVYTVTIAAENGTVEGLAADGKYEHGAEATLTATAAEGYEFTCWTSGKDTVSTENPYKFTVTADVALVANFKKSVVTITKSFDLTPENVGNRFGRQTISVEDVDLGSVQLVIPGFSTEVTEYAEASLAIGDDEPLTATATYQNDTENNKEIYTAVATSTDGSKIYKFTFNVALPTTQNYELYAMGISATVESEEGLTTYYLKGNAILGEEYVPVEFMLDNSGYAEGTIGEVFAVGTGEAEQEGTSLSGVVLLEDESGNTYRIEFTAEVEQPEVEIVVKEEVNVALYNLTVDVQGTMAMVSAGTEELSFWLTLLQTENHYGDYTNDAFSNIWYGDDQLYAAYGDTHVYAEVDGKAKFVVSFISTPDAEGNVTKYNFALYAGEKPSDPTALDNISIEGKAAKAIINGQLIIVKDGVQHNAQGAVIK